jgi:hypothetical protein
MGFGRHLICMRDIRNAYRILVRKHEETDQLGDLGANEIMILKILLNK